MGDDTMIDVKYRLLDLFSELEDNELNSIEQWICSQSYKSDLERKKSLRKSEKMLIKLGKTIKKVIPFEAELPTETITSPIVGDIADCTTKNTCHVDEFLYDRDEIEDLIKEGKIKKHYCLDCNSRNIKELNCISHSMSRQVLQYIFKVLLPSDLNGKQILDVGSRLGSVIYAAYHLTNASSIIGIEINKECCGIQETIISNFSLDNQRIKVIHSDIKNRSDIVSNSNIIIMNALDFFIDSEKHTEVWYFLKKHMKKGTLLILNRSIVDTLSGLGIFEELMDWLAVCKPSQLENEILFDLEECSKLFIYVVN